MLIRSPWTVVTRKPLPQNFKTTFPEQVLHAVPSSNDCSKASLKNTLLKHFLGDDF